MFRHTLTGGQQTMTKKIWYLQQLDLFEDLPSGTLIEVESHFHMKECRKGTLVFSPGDTNTVYIVKRGRVQVYAVHEQGKKFILDVLHPGSVFGDLTAKNSREVFAEVLSDSYICSINKNDFFTLISQHPPVAHKLMRTLFEQLSTLENKAASLAHDNVLNRLIKLIKNLGRPSIKAQNMYVIEPFTHEQLAQMIGISRQTVTTLLNQLEQEQRIKRKGKYIYFHKNKLQ